MKTLRGTKFYKPREIARLGLIRSSTGGDSVAGNYNFIMELIKHGRLKATNYSHSDYRPYYLVSEKEIKRYQDSLTN